MNQLILLNLIREQLEVDGPLIERFTALAVIRYLYLLFFQLFVHLCKIPFNMFLHNISLLLGSRQGLFQLFNLDFLLTIVVYKL